MSEAVSESIAENVPAGGAGAAVESREGPVKKKKKKNRKKLVKRIVTASIAALVVAGIAFGLYKLFKKPETTQEAMTDWSFRGSITTMIQGSGMVQPSSSETIAPTQKGLVQDVYVDIGDYVEVGTPLYSVDSTDAQKALDDAESDLQAALDSVEDAEKSITELYETQAKLNITAPFSGKLLNTALKVGDTVTKGMTVATIFDDSKLRLTQYFSYAYAGEIKAGQQAAVSVPATMSILNATVESVTMIERISPEGGKLFEVVLIADNPGALTAGMDASGTVVSAAGETLYSYESAELENYREQSVEAGASGTVQSVTMKDYLVVTAGTSLARLDSDGFERELRDLNRMLESANETVKSRQKALEDAQKQFENLNAVSPIAGNVMSCTIYAGEEIMVGTSAITIADTSIMYLEAQIDGQDIAKVTPGMMANITQYSGTETYYMGTVISVSMEGKYEYGISYFPAKIEVINEDGSMLSGMYCAYSIAGSQSDDCILVPTQAVKNTELGPCVFVRGDSPDAVELPEGIVPDGFSAVVVETGLSDDSFVEIRHGLDEGVEVFTQFMTDMANSWGYY